MRHLCVSAGPRGRVSLSSDAVKRMFNVAMLALWGLPVAAAVAWFFMTLCFFFSSMFLFPIALFQILELACAWWGVVKLKRWLERRAATKTKQAAGASVKSRGGSACAGFC